ncbi:MAG: LamG protein [Candidatus Poribacteria bacterium]|nr:LamG protein [Candidatus Poribacteria bacterium]
MKTLWVKSAVVYIGLIAISLMFATQISARVDPELAVGIWLFNEGKGDAAKDITKNANDGALKTGPKWVDGKFGKGLEFDGKGAYVEVAKSDNLDITDKISIVGWVYPYFYGQSGKKEVNAADGKSANILSKMQSAGSYIGSYWWEYRNNGQVNAYFAAPAADTYIVPTIPKLPVDKWNHIAATYDSSSGTANVYLDGVLAQTLTTKGFGILRSGVELVIGSGKGAADYGKPFNGMLDEIAIFNTALTQKDVENVMNNGLERELGIVAVSPSGKLANVWGNIKRIDSSF